VLGPTQTLFRDRETIARRSPELSCLRLRHSQTSAARLNPHSPGARAGGLVQRLFSLPNAVQASHYRIRACAPRSPG